MSAVPPCLPSASENEQAPVPFLHRALSQALAPRGFRARLPARPQAPHPSVTTALLVPGGGDVKIESQKLNFKEKAQAKVGSLDNVGYLPAGGAVKVVSGSLADEAGRTWVQGSLGPSRWGCRRPSVSSGVMSPHTVLFPSSTISPGRGREVTPAGTGLVLGRGLSCCAPCSHVPKDVGWVQATQASGLHGTVPAASQGCGCVCPARLPAAEGRSAQLPPHSRPGGLASGGIAVVSPHSLQSVPVGLAGPLLPAPPLSSLLPPHPPPHSPVRPSCARGCRLHIMSSMSLGRGRCLQCLCLSVASGKGAEETPPHGPALGPASSAI